MKAIIVFVFLFVNALDNTYAATTDSTKRRLNSTQVDRLRQDLLVNYDRLSRPAQHYYRTLCALSLKIKHLELDESKSTLTVCGWTRMNWTDEKFRWNPTEYGGVDTLYFQQHDIWTPDIFLTNSAVSIPISNYIGAPVVVHAEGKVEWKPQFMFSVLCDFNLRYWPYDTQECVMNFLSWTQPRDSLDLRNSKNSLDLTIDNSPWKVEKVQGERELTRNLNRTYPLLRITIKLTRSSPAYKFLLLPPIFTVVAFILSPFWLPANTTGKLILNGGTIIIVTMFLFYFSHKLGGYGNHTPLILSFLSGSLVLLCIGIIEATVVMKIVKSQGKQPLPWIFRKHLNGKLGRYFGFTTSDHKYTYSSADAKDEEMKDHQLIDDDGHVSDDKHMLADATENLTKEEWDLFVTIVDRIFFCVFCMMFVIMGIFILL